MAVSIDMLLSRFEHRLDRAGILAGDAIDPRYGDDLSGGASLRPLAVLRPRDTADIVEILRVCDELRQPLVVQGGRTGLAGGARVGAGEAVLSLERMSALSPVEQASGTVIAAAGCPLQLVQDHAEAAGLLFAVDIGARGTATIGGNIATNAGGIRVLRYGNFRAQVLGVEAVLADGSVLSSLKGLAKDNSGYDLSQLFIGSEGTLGVVTRACLRLHPKPVTQSVAFCAMPSLDAALALLKLLRARLGTLLSGFEIIFDPLMSEMARTLGLNAPVRLDAPVYVLADIQGMSPETDEAVFAEALGQAMEDGLVTDAALSQSDREFRSLWALRDDCNRYLFTQAPLLSLDVSVPLPRMGDFLTEARAAQHAADPSARDYVFGHLGDGNLHYCVVTDSPGAVARAVYGCVARAGGSISAEHGIGLDKKPYLRLSRSEAEIAAMRRLKAAFDPNGILNPGRIFDIDAAKVSGGRP